MILSYEFGNRNGIKKSVSLMLVMTMLITVFAVFRLPVSAQGPDYTFSNGAVLLDSSCSGRNILIQNGVFSVTVNGATDVNIIFDSVTMDRRYASDTSGTVENLYSVSLSLGWGTVAQTCPLLLTNNASATVTFRGENNFYAGTNGCTVSSTGSYVKNSSGAGFAGIQVDSGSALTIAPSAGTLNAYGAHQGTGDNSENWAYGYNSPSGSSTVAGGAGIGGGAAYNTSTSYGTSYSAGTPGTIIINGGNINAHGGHQAAGIGGGVNGAATTTSVTINGGSINAYGGRWAAGIGDGDSLQDGYTGLYSASYSIEINGGTVSAVGGVGCPGIGSTDSISAGVGTTATSGLEITINGGRVTAKSGYPDGFNPGGASGYSGTDAAAAIGAGNKTNMASNSITISSAAEIIASGFGSYSVTENGTTQSAVPVVNIDSDGYVFLGRFPELVSHASRIFGFFEAQRFSLTTDDTSYQYLKYISQPDDGRAGEIYYYCPTAPEGRWLMKAGTDGSLANATVVTLADEAALKTKMSELKLTLFVDDSSAEFNEITALAHFRSIAISLPSPQEHGGIYALRIPTASMYGYSGTATLPQSGYVTVTISAEQQGATSGELSYPSELNIEVDAVSETLADLDVYRTDTYTYGSSGLIGAAFMENVFAYKVYIEHDDNTAYIYLRYGKKDDVTTTITADGWTRTGEISSQGIISGTVDMTGTTEKVVRIKKTDTAGGTVLNSIVYKITIVKKAVYGIELNPLDRIYDGVTVSPSILRLYDETTGADFTAADAELASAVFSFENADGTGAAAPKDAGTYKVTAEIHADTYSASGELTFTIARRTLTVNRIANPLTYVSSAEYATWTSPRAVDEPGTIYLSGIVPGDTVTAIAASVFYNDISVGYAVDKITLTGITLSGADAVNYETADVQKVFGQISYALDNVIFRKKPGAVWDKFYPVDSTVPVSDATADYHSPKSSGGVYDAHSDYVYARTQSKGTEQSVYAVDIEFGTMCFSYSKSQWNTNTMTYEELTGESMWTGFDDTNNRVTVTNRSNRVVYYEANVGIDFLHSAIGESTVGIRARFYADNSSSGTPITGVKQAVPAVTAGDGNSFGSSVSRSCYIRLSGVPQLGDSERFTAVGNVTVTISCE